MTLTLFSFAKAVLSRIFSKIQQNVVAMEDKKTEIVEKLQKREDQRVADLQKKRQVNENGGSSLESTQHFLENFNREKNCIAKSLEDIDKCSKEDLVSEFDRITKDVQKLKKFHSDSTMFLPSYDVRQCQETLNKLQMQIQEKRDFLIPKKKFAFKSKKKTIKDTEKSLKDTEMKTKPTEDLNVELAECKIANREKEEHTMSGEDIIRKDIALIGNVNCQIKLFGAPSTVHMKDLRGCTVLCGPVSSSVFITDCKDCTFVIACQQLRTHTTEDCTFYLHVTSRAIIEDCKRLQFAPYNLKYPNKEEDFQISGLDLAKNNWDDVDDFNWLASDVRSPNWNILEEEKRIGVFE